MTSKVMERIKSVDLYRLLELDVDADEKAIKKAYRKRALKCHPDKNPDNPKAAEEFHLLSDAYEVLANSETKKAYDNILKARKAAEVRNRQLDAKRRRLKDDLEAREKAAAEVGEVRRTDEAKLAQEIERLRTEGRRRLEEEQEAMRREIEEERRRQEKKRAEGGEDTAKLKIKWKKRGNDIIYDESRLRTIFGKYGEVRNVVVLEGKKDKKMSGLVEMAHRRSAASAARIESGLEEAPLKVTLMGGGAEEGGSQEEEVRTGDATTGPEVGVAPQQHQPFSDLVTESDFESLVLTKLRQEELRKQEIQRIMEEDAREEEEEKARKKQQA